MDSLSVNTLVLIIWGSIVFMCTLGLIVFGITAYRIAALYAPGDTLPRRVPAWGRHRPADAEDALPADPGVNGWPSDEEKVAAENRTTQIAGAAEVTLLGERDKWWEEQREEGLSDDEIAVKEAAGVVPVFDGA